MNHAPAMPNERVKPAADSPRGAFAGTVTANRRICTDHYRLTLALARFPRNKPGQFVQLSCRNSLGAAEDIASREPRS